MSVEIYRSGRTQNSERYPQTHAQLDFWWRYQDNTMGEIELEQLEIHLGRNEPWSLPHATHET